MDFSLSSSLVGSAVSNPDKLALDLQFAADKTLTARKGPTPTFLRASGATQVNAAGLIEYAPENQLLQSETFGTTWTQTNASVTSNVAIAPDGNTTADKLVENTASAIHGVDQSVMFTAVPHTLSFYAKKDGRTWIRAFFSGLASTWFNIDSGAVGTVASGFTASIVDAGNGWYRCSINGTAAAGTLSSGVRIATGDGVNTYLGDGVSGIFLWGAQLERSSTVRTYIPTTTAAVYGPRFDHDPVSLACKGLLIEESRTNNVSNSGNPTLWTFTGTNEGSLIAPDGSNGLRAGLGTAQLVTNAASTTSATAYTLSVFLKRDNTDWIRVQYNHATNTNLLNAWFNLSTGTVGTVSASAGTVTSISASIVPAGNGWYRCSVTGTTPTTGGLTENIISAVSDNSVSRVAGSIYGVWGGQLELGAFPTSYIPTTTASVIRSADVCSISGSDFSGMYNQPEGTLFADVTPQTVNQLSSVFTVNTITSNNQHGIYKVNAAFAATGLRWGGTSVIGGAIAEAAIATSTDVATSRARLSYSYKLNDFVFSYAGTIVGTDTSGLLPSPTSMHIGNRDGSLQINGHLASVRYYKKRLPNAKLASLTV